jgi:D-alanine transaminase
MSRVAYVNGRYLPHHAASVHIEDRGYQFADGVYEVIAVARGRLVDEGLHLARLSRSLRELEIAEPMPERALQTVMREVLSRNRVADGIIYIQMTRGVAPRDHAYPKHATTQVVMTARRARPANPKTAEEGVSVITIPDIRWARCDIKSVSLLPNVMGKQRAREAGAYEAWQVNPDGMVSEGTSTNAWIVTAAGEVITRKADHAILNGITRLRVLRLIETEGLHLVERTFSVAEAKAAREAFLTSTTSAVTPVVRLDGAPIADGKPGAISRKLRQVYERFVAGEGQNQ